MSIVRDTDFTVTTRVPTIEVNEVLDDDSEAYCWRQSGFFWRMRASLGLACAQATTLASQVFGKGNPQSRARRTSA